MLDSKGSPGTMSSPFSFHEMMATMEWANASANAIKDPLQALMAGDDPDDPTVIAKVKALNDQYRERYKAEKTRPLRPLPLVMKQLLVLGSDGTRERLDSASQQGPQIITSRSGGEKPFSVKALSELKPILLSDMKVPHVHEGRYLLLRTCSRSHRMLGVTHIVEDSRGAAINMGIYNYIAAGSLVAGRELDVIFPLGTIFAVKEPCAKYSAVADQALIRVDSPTDIVPLDAHHPLVPAAWKVDATRSARADHRAIGNNFYAQHAFLLAHASWTNGINLGADPGQLVLLKLNRAAASLALRRFGQAARDAAAVLAMHAQTPSLLTSLQVEKAHLRLARALYGLELYEEAKESFRAAQDMGAADSEGGRGLELCEARIRERTTGEYDWVKLFRAARRGDAPRLDAASFVGPIRIQAMTERGGGRGVVATRDIAAGELILMEQPFAMVYPSELPAQRIILSLDLGTDTMNTGTQVFAVTQMAEKLLDDPSLLAPITSLWSGQRVGPSPLAVPDFGAFSHSLEGVLESSLPGLDMTLLEDIATHNAFSVLGAQVRDAKKPKAKRKDGDTGTGIYPRASFFNHSCSANAVWSAAGGMLKVHAVRPVAADEEIFISYINPEETYVRRKAALSKHFRDKPCPCRLCANDRKAGTARLSKRAELLAAVEKIPETLDIGPDGFGSCSASAVRQVKKLVSDLEATFAVDHGPIRPDMFYPYHLLALMLQGTPRGGNGWSVQADETQTQALACVGLSSLCAPKKPKGKKKAGGKTEPITATHVGAERSAKIMSLLCKAGYSNTTGDREGARRYVAAALGLEALASGGGKDLFRLRYAHVYTGLGAGLGEIVDAC